MTRKNLQLSNFRGMNIQDSAHQSDECTRLINFKPTGTGLEMRNGARTVMDGQISGKIVGEENRAMLTSDGYAILEDTDDDDYKVLRNDNYQPFGALDNCFDTEFQDVYIVSPTGDDQSYVATLDENMVVLFDNDPIDENEADKSMALWVYNWNLRSILGCGMGIGEHDIEEIDRYLIDTPKKLCQGNTDEGGVDDAICRVVYGENFAMIEKSLYGNGVVKRSDEQLSISNMTTADALSERDYSWHTSAGDLYVTSPSGTYNRIQINVDKLILLNTEDAGNGWLLSSDGDDIQFNEISGGISIKDTLTVTNLVDFCAFKGGDGFDSPDITRNINVFVLSGTFSLSVTHYKYDFVSESFEEVGVILSGMSGWERISCNKLVRARSTFKKSYGYFVLFNDYEIEKYNFKIDDDENITCVLDRKITSSAFPFVTGGIKDIVMQTEPYKIPVNYHNTVGVRPYFGDSEAGGDFDPTFVDDEIVSSENEISATFSWTSTSTTVSCDDTSTIRVGDFVTFEDDSANLYETRQVVSISDDSSFEISSAIGFAYASGDSVYLQESSDLYTQPKLGSEFAVPVNIEDGVKFNSNVPNGSDATVWQYWLFYVIPSPVLDNSVESLRLLRGLFNENGYYEISAYGEEPVQEEIDQIYIDKQFPNAWTADSVVPFEVGYGAEIFRINNAFEDEFQLFAGQNANAAEVEISTITANQLDSSEEINIMKAVISGATGTPDVGVQNSFALYLEEGQDYWLSFKAAADNSGGAISSADVYVYTVVNGKYVISLKKEDFEIPYYDDGFQVFNWKFTCVRSGRHTFRIDTDVAGAHTLFAGDISLSLFTAFPKQREIAWQSYEDSKFVVQDYKHGTVWNAFMDKEARAVYFSDKGLCYANKGKTLAFPDEVIVGEFNVGGLSVATKKEVYLIGGYTFDTVTKTLVLKYGLPDENYFGLAASSSSVALFNGKGVFYIGEDTYLDEKTANIGKKIWTWLHLTETDDALRRVCFDDINGTLVVQGKANFDDTFDFGDVSLGNFFAIFDFSELSWHVYAYNSTEPSEAFCQFSKTFNNVIVNMGATTTPATDARVCIMEETNDFCRENTGYLNEAWDYMIGNFCTRAMSFDDTGNYKRIRFVELLNGTLRPFGDVAQFNYLKGEFFEQFAPYSPDSQQRVIGNFETNQFNVLFPNTDSRLALSHKERVDCKFAWAAFNVWYGRTIDTENPKLVLISALFDTEYSKRSDRGGF